MTFSNPIVGGTTLIRPAIQSPNFIAGASGWSVNKDGTAEFNNVVIRGTGTTNAVVVGPSNGPQVKIGSTPTLGFIQFPTNRPVENLKATVLAAIGNLGAANEFASLQIQGPTVTGATDQSSINLNSQNNDGSSNASISLRADGSVVILDKTQLSIQPAAGGVHAFDSNRLVLAPVASASSALFVSAASGHTGNLLRAQLNGVDEFVVDASGNTSVTGILSAGNRVVGSANITPSAVNTATQLAITFPATLKGSTFNCVVSANTSVPQNVSVSYRLLSATGVTLVLTRSDNTTTTTVSYMVEGV